PGHQLPVILEPYQALNTDIFAVRCAAGHDAFVSIQPAERAGRISQLKSFTADLAIGWPDFDECRVGTEVVQPSLDASRPQEPRLTLQPRALAVAGTRHQRAVDEQVLRHNAVRPITPQSWRNPQLSL